MFQMKTTKRSLKRIFGVKNVKEGKNLKKNKNLFTTKIGARFSNISRKRARKQLTTSASTHAGNSVEGLASVQKQVHLGKFQ